MKMRFQKKLRGTSAWVFYRKFAENLQNTFAEEHLWGTGSRLYIILFWCK